MCAPANTRQLIRKLQMFSLSLPLLAVSAPGQAGYPLVDTAQEACYDTNTVITAPGPGTLYAGQDAQYTGMQLAYTIGGNGLTVYDGNTGLTWTRSPDLNDDGKIDASDKLSQASAVTYAATLNAQNYGGYDDWRLPSIKELYSLMNFSGVDVSGPIVPALNPFIDTNYFAFGYGDTNAGERIIDAQFATTTLYVDTVMNGQQAMFGLNLADGRIKGYPTSGKNYYVYYVRGNTNYGTNAFVDNGDGTVTDLATGLMWQQADSVTGMNWQAALAYAEALSLAGWQDWRLPNAKELQSIVDYTRSPGITASAAMDPVFHCTPITNEAGAADFPWYWASTTHVNASPTPGRYGVYVCFGRAMGYFMGQWLDVHGAGCQRSDPKGGSLAEWSYTPYGYYSSQAPQGDAIRIFNFARCVRGGASAPTNDADADGLTDWYEYNYTTNTTAMDVGGDLDGDGLENIEEERAGTSPVNGASCLFVENVTFEASDRVVLKWQSSLGRRYRIERSTNLLSDAFGTLVAADLASMPPMNVYTDTLTQTDGAFYRVCVE